MASNTLLINVDIGETRVALIEKGIVSELYIERSAHRSPVGNVYLGKVTRVLPGMQAAFIDIGLERAAFLHVEDVLPPQQLDSLVAENDDDANSRARRLSRKTPIRDVLKEGQSLVVQVSKGPIGTKGARVTSHVSLPGRYAVYLPTVDHLGVSKRIGGDKERRRLREVVQAIKPERGGLIVRTVAHGLTKKQLKADIAYLVKIWQDTQSKLTATTKAPALLYSELDLTLRATRDLFTDEIESIIIDDESETQRLREFLQTFLPERVEHVQRYTGREPLLDEFGVEDAIARALSRKVPLPSGGYLIIDQAEALTAIDVNTGRFTGKGKDVEETILQTNLEAVKEIAYQLRFRNIGGLIVLDFIDMESATHRERLFKQLLDVLRHDKAKTTAVRISELGLVEMTRKRTRDSLGRTLYEPCFYCDGTGHLQSKTSICHEILRQMMRERDALPGYEIVVHAHPAICDMFQRDTKALLDEAGHRLQRRISFHPEKSYHIEQFNLNGARATTER